MKSSRHTKRPLLRSRRSPLNHAGPGLEHGQSRPARLASLAGSSERASVEPLEPRQMLFSLTVTESDVTDPAAGVGLVRAVFGYYLPNLFPDQAPNPQPDEDVEEDLNDEIPPTQPLPNPQNIPSGTIFAASNIQILHNVIPNNNIQIREVTGEGPGRFMRARLDAGQFFSFRPLDADGARIAVTRMYFATRAVAPSNVGLNTANMSVQMFYRGELIQSVTGAGLAALATAEPDPDHVGWLRYTFTAPTDNPGFDELRVIADSGPNDAFDLDRIHQFVPQGTFRDIIVAGIFGAEITFLGKVGASVQLFDLYGNDMEQTIVLGLGTPNPTVDKNGDGVPDFNYGIGRIVVSNSDSTTALTMFGGLIKRAPDPDADYAEGGLVYVRNETLKGMYDLYESAGFGFDWDTVGLRIHGLPPGPGSVIVGMPAPMVRDPANYNPGGSPTEQGQFGPVAISLPVTTGFTEPDQGVFVLGGHAMGSVYIHGMLFGSSQFSGSVERIIVGDLMGSITVQSDLGSLVVAGEAGLWQRDAGAAQRDNVLRLGGVRPDQFTFQINGDGDADITPTGVVKTHAQLVVGRTAGEIMIAGRSLLDATVVGDINDSVGRPPRDVATYYEKEFVNKLLIPAVSEIEDTIERVLFYGAEGVSRQARASLSADQGPIFADHYYRNDFLMSAEWIGSMATGVRIFADLSAQDPVSVGDDNADVFAFASDGVTPITVQADLSFGAAVYFRILDSQGRTVAAPSSGRLFGRTDFDFVQYTPQTPGVYYIVVTDPQGATETGNAATVYGLSVLGMAPVTLGSYRTGANSGSSETTATGEELNNTVTVLAGNIGAIRVGTGRVNGAGAEADSSVITNSTEDADTLAKFRSGVFSVPGTLFNITTGSDIIGGGTRPVTMLVGGDFGTLLTGRSAVAGLGPTQGDLNGFTLSVGGRIAMIDVSGGSGISQDNDQLAILLGSAGATQILSGRAGGNGDIGMIRFGSHVAADSLLVQTSDGSVVGGLLVSQDITLEDGDQFKGIYGSQQGINFNLGQGSDLRFADFPQIDTRASVDLDFNIFVGQVLHFIDDGGGLIDISVTGPLDGTFVGRVLFLPVNGSQGGAIGRIEVNLAGGAVLNVTTTGQPGNADVVSIGQIVVTGADGAAAVLIQGTVQTDVWRITSRGPLAFISNTTDRGDFVAIDASALTDLSIGTGSLGRTQVPAWGPRLIGPFAGLGTSTGGGGGSTADTRPASLPLPAPGTGLMDGDWNSQLYRPAENAAVDGGQAFLDDIGSPFDPYINGLVVRTGGLNSVQVGGAIGDVIVPQGRIAQVSPNHDRTTAPGDFDGIVGTIYATDITQVDIGDGLAQREQGPLSTTGIFAINDIVLVTRENSPRANIHGPITAGNSNGGNIDQIDGVDRIVLTGGGDYIDTHISASNLDNFWQSYNYGDDNIGTGIINFVGGTDADFFRSEIFAGDLVTLELTNGFYDASFTALTRSIGTITAAGFRNSTLTGGNLEFRPNVIEGGSDLVTLTTFSQAGDIDDLIVDISGSVLNEISARSFNRVQIEIDNTITLMRATTDLRASQVNAGQLLSLTAGRNITSSQITISGPILAVTAANSIVNSQIAATGAFGRIDAITATDQVSGSITSSGPIVSVRSIAGDIRATITTTTTRGDVGSLSAGRDLDIQTDITGTVGSLIAGRHIGNINKTGVIVVRGNLASANAGGQLYADLRVGQAITGGVSIGQVSSKPGANLLGSGSIYAFGAINAVSVLGDFDGNIISYSGGINAVAITNGSFLPGNTISAYDGHVRSVVITAGNLYGDIHADWIIYNVTVVADATGTFGDIGVNPAYSSNTPFDQFRNALPVGIAAGPAVQGPRLTAGWDVGVVYVTKGSMFETSIVAGRSIGIVYVAGSPATGDGNVGVDQFTNSLSNVFVAADSIYLISVGGNFSNAYVLAGVVDLGSDNAPAGVGSAHDTMKSGSLNWLYVAGNSFAVVISAGADSGSDGTYVTGDDRIVPGVSWVNNVTLVGSASAVFASADSFAGAIDGRVALVGTQLQLQDAQTDPGFGTPGTPIGASGVAFTHLGAVGTLYFAGDGQAYWDATGGRIVLRNTSLNSYLTVSVDTPEGTPAGTPGTLTNFDIITNDDASMGAIAVGTVVITGAGAVFAPAHLAGDSDIAVDAYLGTLSIGNYSGTGSIKVGENLGVFTSKNFTGGSLSAKTTYVVVIDGDFGAASPFTRGEVRIDILDISGGLMITGADRGAINIDRALPSMAVWGAMDGATLRAGTSISALEVGSMSRTWVSTRDFFGSLVVHGDMFDSSVMAGADLGTDTEFGGTGLAADTVTTGFLSGAFVAGDFRESDLVAGILRGPDGFFGTSDDSLAEGRSIVGPVTIVGSQVGSDRNSEAYRISSTGVLGTVTIGGAPGGTTGNFTSAPRALPPLPFQVTDLQVTQDSRIFTAHLFFNQPADASSLPAALSVSEVRGSGEIEIRLVNGVDYTLTYDASTNSALVLFNRAVTDRNLPQQGGVPGPGIYRFRLDQTLARAQLISTRLDGNADGRSPVGDVYSADDFVGDAGDKLTPGSFGITDPVTGAFYRMDFYGPEDLNIVLDDNRTPDGLPDVNTIFTVRGSIGDHPDHNTNFFRFGADSDVYKITLQAGQILHMGRMSGAAALAPLILYDANGDFVTVRGEGAQTTMLPVNTGTFTDLTFEQAFLIKTTGTYYIVASNFGAFSSPTQVPNDDIQPGTLGDYSFTVEVFDDGNSGFSATTDAGNGTDIAGPPAPTAFAGPDGSFGTGDDLTQITVGQFVYTYSRGADGVPNTADDAVVGTDSTGTILSGRDGTGLIGAVVDSSIGPGGHVGIPGEVFSDVDIYHLNGRLPIATGTKIRATVRLTDVGADLGSRSQRNLLDPLSSASTFQEFRGSVQLGIFDTTTSISTDDALLVASPTDFSPRGGRAGEVTAGENATYGFDSNGDFFIEFLAPGRQGTAGLPASYAVYIQGVFNTDYRLEIVQSPFNPALVPTTKVQNILLETRGGAINWLEAGGLTTTLLGFQASQLGFNGSVVNGQPVEQYIIETVTNTLRAIYNAAGYAVNISTDPHDFELQLFSTVYISAASDPVSLSIINAQAYGYAQHSDPFNSSSTDEAVVFTPGFAALGYTPSQADVNLFTQSLTAAVGRRVGELMGLRVTSDYAPPSATPTPFDLQAANAVSTPPGAGRVYSISNVSRLLSDSFDEVQRTDFYLGRQNSVSLLDKILTPR